MRRDTLWVVLTIAGPALWWWPVSMEPSLDLPGWLPLVFVALWTSLATILSGGRWLRFLAASAVGNFAGLCALAVWWPTDPIARSYLPYTVTFAILAAILVSLVAGLAVRKVTVSNENGRYAVRIALVCCFALGPIAVALTAPIVAHRVRRNDRLGEERFQALKNAVIQTVAEAGGPARICDGQVLKQNYSGPPFSEEDWQRIIGNYVQQDGYVFMVYCHEKGGYTIDASPHIRTGKADGTRQFCTEESGRVGCGMEWNRSRYACTACPR